MRAFIGKVREEDGSYMESLFVVDIPADVDVTTVDSGSADRYPTPPKGLRIRRLTHTAASGVVRGSVTGDRIAYYALDENGVKQVFIVPSDGSDRDADPAKRPVQATRLPEGSDAGLRWHPSGNSIISVSDGGIVATCVQAGPGFGRSVFVTPHGDGPPRFDPVFSPDGKRIAYNRTVPTVDENGKAVRTYNEKDFEQVFVVDFPDPDGDGVAG